MQESIGLNRGFALTAIAYIVGIVAFEAFVDERCRKLKQGLEASES